MKQEPTYKQVTSTIQLPLITAYNSTTGEQLTKDIINNACRQYLTYCQQAQNTLIRTNINTLPTRKNTQFGSAWARNNINTDNINVPDDYIEKYWTTIGNQIEAARLIISYQQRDAIATLFDKYGWDATYETITKHGGKYIKRNLYKNVKASGKHPSMPIVKSPRFPYASMNKQVCQQAVFNDVLVCHNMAIGNVRYDLVFYTGTVLARYDGIVKVTRPTLRLDNDGDACFDFSVIESVLFRSPDAGHVVGFDRNMDHASCISGVRVNADGSCSRELGPSLETLAIVRHRNKLLVERDRCEARITRLMPWQDSERARLVEQVGILKHKIDDLGVAIDWHEAEDVVGHALPGEVVGLERLDVFSGGFVKFRHGSTDEKVGHALERCGSSVVMVSPAGTSCDCPCCGSRLSFSGTVRSGRVGVCSSCGFRVFRDYGAGACVGERAGRSCGVIGEGVRVGVPSCDVVVERGGRRRARRLRKMRRRRARGKRVFRVGSRVSPRRPRRGCGARAGRVCGVGSVSGGSGVSFEEVWGLFHAAIVGRQERHGFDAGAFDRTFPFGAWGSTLVLRDCSAFRTCYAYYTGLREHYLTSIKH